VLIFRRAGDHDHDCEIRSGPPVVVAEIPLTGGFDVADKNFLLWRGTKMRGQLRDYLVALGLDKRRNARREERVAFEKWLGDKENPADVQRLGAELEATVLELQDGGPKSWRFVFSIPLIISILVIAPIWIIGTNWFANFVGLYGIICLALGGLAAFGRFSDLFRKSYTEDLRIKFGLSRNDFIGLFGTAGIIATTAASYFRFTTLASRLTADNQEVIAVLKAILEAVKK